MHAITSNPEDINSVLNPQPPITGPDAVAAHIQRAALAAGTAADVDSVLRNELATSTDNTWVMAPVAVRYDIGLPSVVRGLRRRLVRFMDAKGETLFSHAGLDTSLLRSWADAVLAAKPRLILPHPIHGQRPIGLKKAVRVVAHDGKGLSLLADGDLPWAWIFNPAPHYCQVLFFSSLAVAGREAKTERAMGFDQNITFDLG